MANGNDATVQTSKRDPFSNGNKWVVVIVTVLSAFLGTGGGSYYYFSTADPLSLQKITRPDPATGTELRHLQESLKDHISGHPSTVNQFDRRITILETQYEAILENQKRILRELEKIKDK